VTILDAYAVIAYLRGEPCAAEVAELLRGHPALTSVNAAEVCDQMVRVFGADPDGIEADLALLGHAGLRVLPVSYELGMEAGRIRARRYHRERAAVSLADCVAVAVRWLTACPWPRPTQRWPPCSGRREGTFTRCPVHGGGGFQPEHLMGASPGRRRCAVLREDTRDGITSRDPPVPPAPGIRMRFCR
jgi:PIN domain nuclease of toxin-antitoxin system